MNRTGRRTDFLCLPLKRGFLAALIAIFPFLSSVAGGQTSAPEEITGSAFSVSAVSPELEEPAGVEGVSELIGGETVNQPAPRPPLVKVHFDQDQQIPVVRWRGEYFDPSGMVAPGPLSEMSNQSLKASMLRCSQAGYRCFVLRADWPGIQPEANRVESTRVRDLVAYAGELGLKVIVSLELSRAPAWFFRGEAGMGRLMVSYLVDPEMERSIGNDGDLRWSNGIGIPIMYHPDTIRQISKLIYDLYYSLKDEKALLGWYLSGPVTCAYPGGGRGGVVGMCDYSPFSVNRYVETTGTPLLVYPLPRYSQGTRDTRPDFRLFYNLRLAWKREAFDAMVGAIESVDRDHLILVGMDPVLNYRNDNGYLAQVMLADSTRQLVHSAVDGAVINFRLASDSFYPLASSTESSAMHLQLTIAQALRNGKLALVMIEPDSSRPPSVGDIADIAQMIKAAGAYPLWASGFLQKTSRWSREHLDAIERTQPLTLLPPPHRLRRGEVAILDLPAYYSSFYAEQNETLKLSLLQLAMHQRTGVVLEVIGSYELTFERPVLSQYRNLIYLTTELTTSQEAKSWIDPGTQLELAAFKRDGGVIEAVDPMLLHQYVLEGYHSAVLEDELRTRYVHRGATADLLHGADAFIVANEPYVFFRINSLYGARYIDVQFSGWPEASLRSLLMADVEREKRFRMQLTGEIGSFTFPVVRNEGFLYLTNDEYEPIADVYAMRRTSVAIAQQSRNMRRAVPAALLFAALLGVSMLWMAFQSQQVSLLQAAELAERRRAMLTYDILDDAEVMAFYKTYVEETGEDNTAQADDSSRKRMK